MTTREEQAALDPWGDSSVDVHCLRVAIDARAARHLTQALAPLAIRVDASSAERLTSLRGAAFVLRRLREVWLAGGAATREGLTAAAARQQVQAWVTAARVTGAGGDGTAVVANVVLATPAALFTPEPSSSLEDVRSVLEALSNLAGADIYALDISVGGSPGIDLDHPPEGLRDPPLLRERRQIDDQIFCSSCGAPFPTGLEACPNCGRTLAVA